MADVVYIWNGIDTPYSTQNDIAIFGYADGWNDGGQVIIGSNKASNSASALQLTRDKAYLHLGGDYHVNPGTDQYNIYLNSTSGRNSVSAVYFSKNGYVNFAAQSGAGTAGSVKRSGETTFSDAENLDSNINIAVKQQSTSLMNNALEVATINGQQNLEIVGDITGKLAAESETTVEESTKSGETLAENNTIQIAGVLARGTLTIGGNVQTEVSAANKTTLTGRQKKEGKGYASSVSVSGNTISAAGINAASIVTDGTCIWKENVTIQNTTEMLSLVKNYANPQGVKSAHLNSNSVGSYGLYSVGDFQIQSLVSGNWNVSANNTQVTGEITDYWYNEEIASLTVSNNAVSAIGIAVRNFSAEDIKDLTMDVSASGNIFTGANLGEDANTVIVSGNAVSAMGISAQDITLGNMWTTNDISVSVEENKTNSITAYGLYAANALTAKSLRGSISVIETNNQADEISVAGIKAGSLTVTGLFIVDFSVRTNSNAGTKRTSTVDVDEVLRTPAFFCTINEGTTEALFDVGLQAKGGFASAVEGDDFDLNGSIYGVKTGIASSAALNLRVSGEIMASKNAIYAESSYGELSSEHTNDFVRIAQGAKITGNVELSRGDNTLIINSGATIDGNILATHGRLSLFFNLDQVNDKAVITTDNKDVTLYSTVYVSINLNDAVNNQEYTLFQFEDDVQDKWANRRIAFVYDNLFFNGMTDANGHLICESDDKTVSAEFTYTEDNRITLLVEGVESPDAIDGSKVITQYDADELAFSFDWSKCQWDAPEIEQGEKITELEYCVKDADGNFYGESVSVLLRNGETSYTVYGLAEGESIGWRLRYASDLYNYNVTDWTTKDYKWEYATPSEPEEPSKPDVSLCNLLVGEPGDHESVSGGVIRTAVARLFWDEADSEAAIEHYTVEYVEDRNLVTSAEEIENLFNTGTVYRKEITGTEVLVSSLTNGSHVYWRLKATDVEGEESEYQYGRSFQVNRQDKIPPEFTDVQEKVAYDTSDRENLQISGILAWNEAVDELSMVQDYFVSYGETGTSEDTWIKIVVGAAEIDPITIDGKEYAYHVECNIENLDYTVKVHATDSALNSSDPIVKTWVKDATGPVLKEGSISVTPTYIVENPSRVFITANAVWSPGTDSASGVKEYKFTYWKQNFPYDKTTITVDANDIDPITQMYSTGFSSFYEGETYSYQLTATDYCGNVGNVLTGTFGGDDCVPPEGAFYDLYRPEINVVYTRTAETKRVGNKTTTTYTNNLVSASATFSWSDSYTDTQSPVCYKIQFSSNSKFAEETTYTFYNTPADGKTFTLSNDIPTMSIGVLSELAASTKLHKVYWRVMAMDNPGKDASYALVTEGNETGVWSNIESFYFCDDNGDLITTSALPAAAKNITLSNDYVDGCYTSGTHCGYSIAKTLLGVQSFDVHVYSYATRSEEEILSYTYDSLKVEDRSAAEVSIVDKLDLADGCYAVWIVTRDAYGQENTSDKVDVLVDTARPSTVTGIQFQQSGRNLSVSWQPSYDATGISGYLLGYRYKTLDGSAAWNWTKFTTDTSVTIPDMAVAEYEFVVYSYDTSYLDWGKTQSNRSLASEIATCSVRDVTVRSTISDYNGSGKSDMIQFVDGKVYVTYDDADGKYVQTAAINDVTGWNVVEIRRDLTGDGLADVQITADDRAGSTWVATLRNDYLKNNAITLNYQFIGAYDNTLWSYLGSADVNGDGKSEVLMIQTAAGADQYGHRNVAAWVTDENGMWEGNVWVGSLLSSTWSVTGTADVTGDGQDNVILRRADGILGYWKEAGSNEIVGIADSTNRVMITSADFDGDNADDFLFSDANGDFFVWSNIGTGVQDNYIGNISDLSGSWAFAGAGDYNGDGKNEILWCDGRSVAYSNADKDNFKNLTIIA